MVASGPLSKSTLLLLLFCASAVPQGAAAIQDPSDPRRGRLSGLVEDENGQPLAGATVKATPPGILAAIVPNTLTDGNGRFGLAGLIPGHTYLQARKEDAFYPDTGGNLWNSGQGSAEVDVPVGGEISGILLRVSPAARIEVKATDAVTGATIDYISVHIERDGSRERFISTGRKGNSVLVPTDPIRLRFDANGYESAWYTQGNSYGPAVLRRAPRQVLTVTIRLRQMKIAPGIPLSFCCFPSSDFSLYPAARR